MHKAVESVLLFLFAVGVYVGLPVLIAWGWVRWFRRIQPRTLPVILSLIGFTLATASGLLAVSSVVYAHAIGGFPFYDPRLLRIYRWGGLLSLSGLVFGPKTGDRRDVPHFLRYAAKMRASCLESADGFFGRPGFRGRSGRKVACSRAATNSADPSGRPV